MARKPSKTHIIKTGQEFVDRYGPNPELFVRELLKGEPTKQQSEALKALSKPGAKVSIRSGHGTGKTSLLAWVILWHLTTTYDCKIPCTAPTGHQLYDVLWAELYKWRDRLPAWFYNALTLNSEACYVQGLQKINFAVARTARKEQPEALQGFHAKNLLFVIDEASGVDDSIFEVARGALSSEGARVILTGNPVRNQGYFYNSHHANRAYWTCLHFNGEDSPLVSRDFVKEMGEEFGRDSDVYRVRVLGEFPKAEPDQLISLSVMEEAVRREQVNKDGPVVWGLDPAYLGDCETALAERVGDECTWVEAVKGFDNMQVVGWIRQKFDFLPRDLRPKKIVVDTIGYGAGVHDRLRELGYPVLGVNVGRKGSAKYTNIRDELWFKYRDWLMDRGKVPDDGKLIGQSTAIKILPPDSGGRVKVESKDHMRKRNIVSPDRADALCLTFYWQPELMKPQGIDRYDRSGQKVSGSRARGNWGPLAV